jgi:hypothetical protein
MERDRPNGPEIYAPPRPCVWDSKRYHKQPRPIAQDRRAGRGAHPRPAPRRDAFTPAPEPPSRGRPRYGATSTHARTGVITPNVPPTGNVTRDNPPRTTTCSLYAAATTVASAAGSRPRAGQSISAM